MSKRIVAAFLILASAGAAHAQLQLGERPIKRSEVTATVKKQFAEMDVNKDGFVSPQEFERYRAAQNAQPRESRGLAHIGRTWFEKCDTNGDGRVSFAEAEARPLRLFDMADLNRDGVASLEEQQMAMLFMK